MTYLRGPIWFRLFWFIGLFMLLNHTTLATPKPDTRPDFDWRPITVQGFDSAEQIKNFNLSDFKTVWLAPVELEYSRHWMQDRRWDLTKREMEKMRESYATLLFQVLSTDFLNNLPLTPVEKPDQTTLILAAKLTDFRIHAPDPLTSPGKRYLVENAGAARLEITLINGQTGAPILRARDERETRHQGGLGDLKETNRAMNHWDFKMLYKHWAKKLTEHFVVPKVQTPAKNLKEIK